MIFLDTNVLVDLLEPQDNPQAFWSRKAVADQAGVDGLATNLIVVAELAAELAYPNEVEEALATADVSVLEIDVAAALLAAAAFREYRRRGGPRRTILPDFLIAGHAVALGATFVTRDRRLGSYFPDLNLITPETQP